MVYDWEETESDDPIKSEPESDSSDIGPPLRKSTRAGRFTGSYDDSVVRIGQAGPMEPVEYSTWGDVEAEIDEHEAGLPELPEEADGRPIPDPDMPELEAADIMFVPNLEGNAEDPDEEEFFAPEMPQPYAMPEEEDMGPPQMPVELDLTGDVPVIRAPKPQLNEIIIPITVGLVFFLVASQL